MPRIPWNSAPSWFLGRASVVLAAAALLFVAAAGNPAVGSTPRGKRSNSPAPPIQNSMTLKCQLGQFATLTADSKSIQGRTSPGSAPLKFRVVDGHLFKFDPGPMKLRLLSTSRTSASMFFELLTVDGNVQLWSFHRLQNGRVLYSGQLSLNDSGPTMEKIEMWTQAGYCDATGGNGQPIRK